MNPVIGLDVSKGESQVQAFLDKGKPYCFIKVEDLIERPLIREKHQKPRRSFWQKVLD